MAWRLAPGIVPGMQKIRQDDIRQFIRDRLRALGISESSVSLKLERHRGYIHDYLNGKQKQLPYEERKKLAEILQAPSKQLGLPAGEPDAPPMQFAEDMVAYTPGEGDPFVGLTGPNRYLWMATTNVCDNIGIRRGLLMVVDDSQKAIDNLKPLDVVQVIYHPPAEPNRALQLIRQFVPPRLLITNCAAGNLPSLDLARDDVQIVGLVTPAHLAAGA